MQALIRCTRARQRHQPLAAGRWTFAALLVALTLASNTAVAESSVKSAGGGHEVTIAARTAANEDEQPPSPGNAQPVNSTNTERAAHRREGFYLRANAGLSLGKTFVSNGELSHQDYSVGGAGLELDLLLGGSPRPGLATGGSLSFLDVGLGSSRGTGTLVLIGAFMDDYLLENSGWHLGGQLGVVSSHTRTPNGVDNFDGGGLSGSLWLGDDFTITGKWGLGALLRFNGAFARDPSRGQLEDSIALRGSTYQLAVLLSATYY